MVQVDDFIIDDEMLLQYNRDVAKHSFTGAYIYLIIWFAITIPISFHDTAPTSWLTFTFLLTILAATRILLFNSFDKIYTYTKNCGKDCSILRYGQPVSHGEFIVLLLWHSQITNPYGYPT